MKITTEADSNDMSETPQQSTGMFGFSDRVFNK